MKTLETIGSIIVVTALVLVSIFVKRSHSIPVSNSTVPEPVVVATSENQELCFSKNFNGDITEAKITINNGNVSGTFNWIPIEKDSARGTVSGTVDANGEMNLIYDYMIEGAHQTEEKVMKIENGKLLIKHGELLDPKYDGHLVYKDVSTATYSETLEACVE